LDAVRAEQLAAGAEVLEARASGLPT
jgi:DNA-directed RNA polymerase subunit K/omega